MQHITYLDEAINSMQVSYKLDKIYNYVACICIKY